MTSRGRNVASQTTTWKLFYRWRSQRTPSNTQTKMAASFRLKSLFSVLLLQLYYFFLSFNVVSLSENTTDVLNTSMYANATDAYFDLFGTASSEPTELNSTQAPTASTAAEPVVTTEASVEPLPVSGRLPPPVTDSESFILWLKSRCHESYSCCSM